MASEGRRAAGFLLITDQVDVSAGSRQSAGNPQQGRHSQASRRLPQSRPATRCLPVMLLNDPWVDRHAANYAARSCRSSIPFCPSHRSNDHRRCNRSKRRSLTRSSKSLPLSRLATHAVVVTPPAPDGRPLLAERKPSEFDGRPPERELAVAAANICSPARSFSGHTVDTGDDTCLAKLATIRDLVGALALKAAATTELGRQPGPEESIRKRHWFGWRLDRHRR